MNTGRIKSWWFGRWRIQLYWPHLGVCVVEGIPQLWATFDSGFRFGASRSQQLGGFKLLGFGLGLHRHPVASESPPSPTQGGSR